ncbi:Scarecrow-like protein 6 [Zea mays]|jgi:hypothetical protein|uniref:Scarecrow-like protein 6 n=1 Tax=Zea mays TaxID=4577 RepID=A0A1D6HTM0_MAIZE|nr:Scarecrow-like protein 6 [Zea mays]
MSLGPPAASTCWTWTSACARSGVADAGAGAALPAATLKVTALVSPASHHSLELNLIHENLSGFARELGVFLQFVAYNVDALDPAELVAITSDDAVAVHLRVGSAHVTTMSTVLRLVKRLGVKVVVSVDRGCDLSALGGEIYTG